MQLNSKAIAVLIVLVVLWILWCFYTVTELTPRVAMYLTFYRWLTSWVLCLLPPSAIAAVLVFRIKRGK